jgi:hypothetical protein
MKFTTTNNHTYRAGIGNVPKSWIDYGYANHKESVWKYFNKNIKLWDWDEGGSETHDFVFEDGKAYRLEYSWWSEWYHKDDEENGLKDEVYIEVIALEDAKVPDKNVGRDWL